MDIFITGFVLGVISVIAVGIFIWAIKRKGGHNESGVDDAINREGILDKRIEELQGELLIARSEISNSRDEIRNIRAGITQAENRIKSTDGLVDDLKERNSS